MSFFGCNLEKIGELETNFLKIFYYDFKKYYKNTYKTCENIRLCTILSGEKDIKIHGKSYKYDKNQIMLLLPYSQVEIEVSKPTKALVIEISNKLIDFVREKINVNLEINFDVKFSELLLNKDEVKFEDSLRKILDTSLRNDRDKLFLIDLYSQELVYDMLYMKEINFILNSNFNNSINKSIRIMEENILEKVTITDIAKELNMSVSNFSSKFKDVIGVSPNTYLRKLKLKKAKDMLKYKSVTEVSCELGYYNISYFISLFKRVYGVTPKQYILNDTKLRNIV
ncbi:MAG: AraC family transcriptional regulator [Clostridium perfringens]|nr:AraC family transcriptional regulator [Clostridium perfringens]